jgi:hypothetical protein
MQDLQVVAAQGVPHAPGLAFTVHAQPGADTSLFELEAQAQPVAPARTGDLDLRFSDGKCLAEHPAADNRRQGLQNSCRSQDEVDKVATGLGLELPVLEGHLKLSQQAATALTVAEGCYATEGVAARRASRIFSSTVPTSRPTAL